MDRTDVSQLVLEAYETRCQRDGEGMLACFHPRVTLRIHGDPAVIPFAGAFHGREGVARCVSAIDERIDWLGFQLDDLLIDGLAAAVRWHAPMRARANGREATVQCVDMITVKDHLIVSFDEYMDTAMAVTLLGIVDLDTRVLAGLPAAEPALASTG